MKKLLVPLILLLFLPFLSAEESTVTIQFFFTEECEHCAAVKVSIDTLQEAYGERVEIEMIDVFSREGYEEFNRHGFIMTPGIVFNEQIKVEGEISEEALGEILEYFLSQQDCVVRFFYDKYQKDVEYQRIENMLTTINSEEISILYLDYENNRNDFLYFGFSEVPAVAVNEISFEGSVSEDLINSAVDLCIAPSEVKIIVFYADDEERTAIEAVLSSDRYAERVVTLWVDVRENTKEFYLEGFSATPSVVLNGTVKMQEVTEIDLIRGIEKTDSSFFTPLRIYLIAYPVLQYIVLAIIALLVGGGIYLWRR